ncbi:hypothetical protein Tco_0429636 [Tanacetum coccineum]
MSKVLQEGGFGSLPSSIEINPRDQVKLIFTTIKVDSHYIRRIGSSQYAVSTRQNSTLLYKSRQMMVPFPSHLDNHYCKEEKGNHGPKLTEAYGASHINNTIPRKEKDPERASISVMPLSTYLNLGLGKLAHTRLTVELADRTVKYPKGIARGRRARLSKRILRRNQGDDLMPTIEEGEVIEKFRTRNEDLDIGIDDYPSYCDDDKKIHIDCAHNLKFSCMIGFEVTHVNFYPLLYVNVMSRKFHNSIMQNKMVYKGDNVVGALMNVPIFVETFSVMTDFAVLEDMDAYRDEGMGDIIISKPFL